MLKINKEYSFSKVGIDEIEGLKDAMMALMRPIDKVLKNKMYWIDKDASLLKETEYKSRDGFIPYNHNCGGIEVVKVIPDCERCEFDFLEFGEWDGEHYCDGKDGKEDCECSYAVDGEYDAKLRIWFKFEGYDEKTGELSFYLYLGGGNGDAPYFRTDAEQTILERSFTCKSVEGLKRASSKHLKDLLKIIK